MPQNLGEQERVNVEVACPLSRLDMTPYEAKEVYAKAIEECKKLITPDSRILGLIPPPRLEEHVLTDQPTLIFTFACEVPGYVQERAKTE